MRSRSRLNMRVLPKKNSAHIHLVCAWMCLSISTLVYFGSLLAIVYIGSYDYSVKWNFVVFVATSGILYLSNVISNGILISLKSSKTSNENGVSTRTSATINSDVDIYDPRLPVMLGAEGFCNQEVQTNARKISPPPSYEDLSVVTSEDVQPLANEERPQAHSSPDVIEMLNKILLAVNNSGAIGNEQLSQRQQETPQYGTLECSQPSGNGPATSGSSLYPRLPQEVLDHLSDPNAFIKALAIHNSKNRLRQCNNRENGKKAEERNGKCLIEQKRPRLQNFQGLQSENGENSKSDISNSSSSVTSRKESLNSTPRSLKKSSLSAQQKSIDRNRQLYEQGNCYRSMVASQKLGLLNSERYFNSVDNLSSSVKSREPLRAHSNLSLPIKESSISPKSKEVSQEDRSCQRVLAQSNTSNVLVGSMKDLDSSSSKSTQQNLTPQCRGVFNQDHGSTRDSQQNITSKYQRISKENFGSTKLNDSQQNPTQNYQRVSKQNISPSSRDTQLDLCSTRQIILQDFGSANSIGIPLTDYPSNRPECILDRAKPEEHISFDQMEHERARLNRNDPMRKTSSIHALHQHQCTPSEMGQVFKTASTSDSNLLEVKAVHEFSTERVVRDNMKPSEWIAAWNRSLDKISHKDDSTLIGARL